MSDPILSYLKSIDERTSRIEGHIDQLRMKHDERISSLEETRTSQRGMMIGGGVVVTFFAGLVSWIVGLFTEGGQ